MPQSLQMAAVREAVDRKGVGAEGARPQPGDEERPASNRSDCSPRALRVNRFEGPRVSIAKQLGPTHRPNVFPLFAEARPSYNEGTGVRRPTILRVAQKFDDKLEQQSLQDFMNDEESDGRLDTMAAEDDFTIPVVLKEGSYTIRKTA